MREILDARVCWVRVTKRGSGVRDLSLDEAIILPHQKNVDLIRLDDALHLLARLDERTMSNCGAALLCGFIAGRNFCRDGDFRGYRVPRLDDSTSVASQ